MPEQPVVQFHYSNKFEDYRPFFDHEWATSFLQLAGAVGVQRSGAQLALMWKGASLVRSMSWLMADGTAQLITSKIHEDEPLSLQIVAALSGKITKQSHVGGIFLDAAARAGLVREIKNVEAEVRGRFEKSELRQEPDEVWKSYLQFNDFRLAVWHAELGAFSQLYFAYEKFLVQCLEERFAAARGPKERHSSFMDRILGAGTSNYFWGERPVAFARFVRHAITHNSAMMTKQLESFRDWLITDEQGTISIPPSHTATLFGDLAKRATAYARCIGETRDNTSGRS